MSDNQHSWRSVIDDLFGGWWRSRRPSDTSSLRYFPAPAFAGTNLKSAFSESVRSRELRETWQSWESVQALWRASPLANRNTSDLAIELMQKASERAERVPAVPVLVAVAEALEDLLRQESIGDIEPRWDMIETHVETGIEFREMLVRRRRWADDFHTTYAAFSRIVLTNIDRFFKGLPESCFGLWNSGSDQGFEVVLLDLLDDPATVIQGLYTLPYDDDTFRLDLFKRLREICADRILSASGLPPQTDYRDVQHKFVFPIDPKNKHKTGAELAELYLAGNALKGLLDLPVPFRIPDELRFEHCHIVGGTGHGKTQLMQKMIHADLLASQEDGRSVIVIDSQGDLINKLVHLDLFATERPDSLGDRLVVIDPSDMEFPAALNLFDAHLDRVRAYSAVDRERVLNGVIELYELFFGAFLGAELTQKQGVVFKYLARLMLAIPDATIHTLMRIMEDGRPYKHYMDLLDGSARYFFETEFFHPSFAATKKQVLRRLWGVLSTPAFERMFTQPKNKLDLFEAMSEGKIILVSTAKDLLKRDGSQLLGRFFIAMIAQAALERSTLSEYLRRPVFVYVDEAQEYFDDNIETILNQARKYRVGLTLAHQTLDQLSPRLRSSILANTSVKCAGGVSAKDARALSEELRTTTEFIEGMKRRGPRTEFAAWVKNLTGQAIRLTVPLGYLERQAMLDDEEYEALISANRGRYCGTLADIPAHTPPTTPSPLPAKAPDAQEDQTSKPEAARRAPHGRSEPPSPIGFQNQPTDKFVETTPVGNEVTSTDRLTVAPTSEQRELGKGGKQHRYLQSLVKELAEQQGLKATIEAPLPDGGQVDVLIEREGVLAAVEISVTTPVAHEQENLRKCLAGSYPRILVVLAKSKSGVARYKAALLEPLTDDDRKRVAFLIPEELPSYIASLSPSTSTSESVVKGYRVRVSQKIDSPEEAQQRQQALAKVIARSLTRSSR